MAKTQLTKEFIGQVSCPAGAAKVDHFDTVCPGLMLEVRPSGRKTFYFRYTNERRQQRQYRIGQARDLGLDVARLQVQKLRSRVALGEDLVEQRRVMAQVPTVSAFIHQRYLPFVQGYKRSWTCDRGLLANHIEPLFGRRHLDQVSKSDVVALMAQHRLTHAPGSCNRLLVLLRYVYSLALKWEVPGLKHNPTQGIPLMPENNKRERYLSKAEAERLDEAVRRSENPLLQHIVALLILTGARKREVLDARWEDFDLQRRLWRIPITKLGRPRHVPISDAVMNLLSAVPKHDSGWLFPNPKTHKPFVSIFYSWDSARQRAGLEDVRIHDLRHSFASLLINSGRTLYEVQHLLGHTQIKTTQRYAHLSNATLLDAANAAGRALGLAAQGSPGIQALDVDTPASFEPPDGARAEPTPVPVQVRE
jgi:integrase